MTDIIYNGRFIGDVADVGQFTQALREKRRAQELPIEMSVRYDKSIDMLIITTDTGRVLRPLIVVKNGVPALKQQHIESLKKGELSWNELIALGVIEYIDAAEEENLLVAMSFDNLTPEHTHLEIDPIAMFGLTFSLIPYANHDHTSRLGKVGRSQKQALGLYAANHHNLIDTDVSILHYPQQPIIKSFVYDTIKGYPFGQNIIVAIMPYEGYNISDALVINKASIERGMGRSTYFRPYISSELHYTGNLKDELCVPTKDVSGYRTETSYRNLEDDGIIFPEAVVNANDVVIGKVSPPKFMLEMEEISLARAKKENSTVAKHGEEGIVDGVFVTINSEGHRVVHVRTRDNRIPELGDKFASPHGQKGVLGFIAHEEDLPFTARGVRPDLIFNPHGVPSRLTVGYLIEMLAGKVGSMGGKIIDGTAFTQDAQSITDLEQQLLELGFRQDGKETLYDGLTGKPLKAKIFIGNMYYLKLKYMVSNKIQTRASGKITLLTRQPVEGRAKGGALRLGEMEKDALVAHGAALLLKERFSSDNVMLYICPLCGSFGIKDRIRKIEVCPLCNSQRLEPIEVSYASKLLIDELISLHLFPKLILKNKFED
jgi:DNA-directed RNA polymerase subunit B'